MGFEKLAPPAQPRPTTGAGTARHHRPVAGLAVALFWLGAGAWALTGCQAGPAGPTATPTPSELEVLTRVTATPDPAAILGVTNLTPSPEINTPLAKVVMPATATPVPFGPTASPNPNLVLRATATEPPTPDAGQNVQTVVYADEFDGQTGWQWPYTENEIAAFSMGGHRLNAVMKVGNLNSGQLVGGPPALQIGDQQLQVTVLTNLCYAKDEYGVLFRANATATDGYLFKLSCEGKARVEALHNLKPAVLVDWTASPAIMPNAPAENTLLVWAGHDQLHFFVNDKYLFSATDKTFVEGTYGFFIYDHTSGGVSVSFDHLIVKAVSLP
jgi:hypothetical protein